MNKDVVEVMKKAIRSKTPKCKECGDDEYVELAKYGKGGAVHGEIRWVGYECTKCNVVVLELFNIDQDDLK